MSNDDQSLEDLLRSRKVRNVSIDSQGNVTSEEGKSFNENAAELKTIFESATKAFHSNNYDFAIKLYTRVITNRLPRAGKNMLHVSYYGRGLCYANKGLVSKAILDLKESLKLEADSGKRTEIIRQIKELEAKSKYQASMSKRWWQFWK